jgi:hypothetical protein
MALAGNVMIPSSGTISDLPAKERTTVALATSVAFLVVFADPLINTMRTWWSDPEAGHGSAAGAAGGVGWRGSGVEGAGGACRAPLVGVAMLVDGRSCFGTSPALAAEAFVGRASMFLALAGARGLGGGELVQLRHWWLPVALAGAVGAAA